MTLVPPSPQWDAYVAERRASVRPAWDDWRSYATGVNYPPPTVTYGMNCLGPGTTDQIHVRCRDGRESQRFKSTRFHVADDWNTLESWDLESAVPTARLADIKNVRPDTVWGQDTVVVLTEQLNDVFVAPADMDVTDISAWLDLFQLRDNLASRKELASVLMSRTDTRTVRPITDYSHEWMSRWAWERYAAARRQRNLLAMMTDPAVRHVAGVSVPATITRSALIVDPQSLPRLYEAGGPGPLRGRGDHDYYPISLVDHSGLVEIVIARPVGPRIGSCVSVCLPRALYRMQMIGLPDDCFDANVVSRPIPLSVSLPAAACPGSGRHTVEP